jgi:4a-hydroxytetrahydrobiopterin dehydratase
MSRPPRLSDIDIAEHLRAHPGWQRVGESITRTFVFAGFPQAVAFIDRLVEPAERLAHHPDIDIRYNRVIVTLTTHDQGGITASDLMLAGEVDRLAAE